MVRNKGSFKRFAFTLIELIFAIVIISIAVVSLPIMAKITERGIESNILQEAIFAGSAELMGASAGYWDTNSMADNAISSISRVIDVSNCENNTTSLTNRLRPGHIAQPLHRRCVDNLIGVTPVAESNVAAFPSLNSAAHGEQDIFDDGDTEGIGYKETYQSIVTVALNADNNIKDITVTVTGRDRDGDGTRDDITKLRMQSANIGEIDYFKRRF